MKTPISVITNANLELNQIIKDTLNDVLPHLSTFVGKKICKVDGSLMKSAESLKALMPTLKHANGSEYPIAHIRFEYRTIIIYFKICKSGGSYDDKPSTAYCEYFERSVTIGQVPNQVLEGVNNYDDIIVGYNLNKEPLNVLEEMAKVEKFKELKAELDELYRSIDSVIRDDQNISLR